MSNLYYRENMLDHSKNPRNWGTLTDFDFTVKVVNRNCGDIFNIYLKTEDSKIKKISYFGEGCAVAVSSASMVLEELEGKLLKDLNEVTEEKVLSNFGEDLTPSRQKCALLIHEGLKKLSSQLQ